MEYVRGKQYPKNIGQLLSTGENLIVSSCG